MSLLFSILFLLIQPGFGKDYGKDMLRVGIATFPGSLNPVYATDETSQAVVNKIFQPLFYLDFQGKIRKGLVAGYHIRDRGREIVLELKKGIRFSNGKELAADDVVTTFRLLRDDRFRYPYAGNLSFIKEIERIERYKFKIALNGRSAVWRNYLTFHITNKDEIENIDPENFRNMILSGTGPYRIKKVDRPKRIVLELCHPDKNPSMYRLIDYVVVANTRLAPLKLVNDEIDICELQPENVDAYKKIEKWQREFSILKYQKFGYTYLVFNLKNAKIPLNIRRHFYHILIRGDFLDKFLGGRGERVKTPFLLMNSMVEPEEVKVTALKENIRLKILTNAESRLRKDFVLFLRNELKPFKIFIEPLFLEYHTFLEYLKSSRFDIAVSGYLLDIDYDMKEIFYQDAYFNYANFNNRQMEQLLVQGLRELDQEKRERIYQAAYRIWLEELPLLPLFNLYYYMGISKRIPIPGETYTLVGPTGDFLFNIEEWKKR